MKMLTNPIVLRMTMVFGAGAFAFFWGMLMVRFLRRRVVAEAATAEDPLEGESFPLHTYHAVIQELKQQKYELERVQQTERRRARTSENVSAAILANLSSGVMFFDSNGLVGRANTAAKQILGFASPAGMTADDVFRGATLKVAGEPKLCEAVKTSLLGREFAGPSQTHYITPSGKERVLDVNLTPVRTPAGVVLGTACLITDRTEIDQIRRQQELRGEMSAEMALALRNSLATISGYAQQLAVAGDADFARQLASDIAAEAAHLDSTIGGFLTGNKAAKAAAGS